MNTKTPKFFIKLKNAVFNFDEYKTFIEERTSKSIVYLVLLMLIFSIVITICVTIRFIGDISIATKNIEDNCSDFSFENNILIIKQENKQFIMDDDQTNFGFIINSEKENINEIQESNNYDSMIAILKDKIVIKNVNGTQRILTYEKINENFEINKLNKQTLLNLLSSKTMIVGYLIFAIFAFYILYIVFLLQTFLDILVLSLIAFLLSKIIRIKLKYQSIFNISVYSLTLSIILSLVYKIVNLFTNFDIRYFDIAYSSIAYIYIITVLLIIKSDLIKQNMELTRIVQVQKQIKEEKNQEEEPEEDKGKKKKEKQEKKEKKQEEKQEGQAPEGT